jgi:hypothetical protein
LVAGATLVLAGCSVANTPLQELAWDRWKLCDRFPTVTLKEVRTNGDIWVWTHYGTDYAAWQECDRAARAEQARARKFTAASMPGLSAADAKGLVRVAYFTDQPPADSPYLLSPMLGNMPRDVKVFPAGSPVTFFYGINGVGRVVATKTNWIGPDGAIAKSQEQTIGQIGSPGTWIWRTQRADSLLNPGRWIVELLIDGHPVGTYEFVVNAVER